MESTTVQSTFNFLGQGWVGSAIGLIATILSIIFYRRSRRRARPSVQLSKMTILSPNGDEIPSDVKILYKGKEISQLSKTNIIFWNDGTETLHGTSVVEDFPIQISFEKGATILRHQIIKETRPVNKSRLEQVDGINYAINIKFDYLDPKDGINVEILHDSKSNPIITGAIRGIPSGIKNIDMSSYSSAAFISKFFVSRFFNPFGPKSAMVITVIAGLSILTIGLLSKHYSIGIENFGYSKGDATAMIIFGCIYTLAPMGYFWLVRRRYPKNLIE